MSWGTSGFQLRKADIRVWLQRTEKKKKPNNSYRNLLKTTLEFDPQHTRAEETEVESWGDRDLCVKTSPQGS